MRVFTETEYTIRCARCGCDEVILSGDAEYRWNDTPSRYFHRQGWRTGPKGSGDNICPVCALQMRGEGLGGQLK